MPRSQQARFSFSAGVVTPRASARADSENHQKALLEGNNWLVTPQGGLLYRQGMKYVGVPFIQDITRILQFHQGGDVSDIVVEVTAGKLRFWRDGALIEYESTVIEIDNAYTQADLPNLYFTNQESLGVITHQGHPPKLITLEQDGNITARDLTFEEIPTTAYNDSKSPSLITGDTTYVLTFPVSWVAGVRYTIYYNNQPPLIYEGNEPLVLERTWDDTTPANNETAILALMQANPLLGGAGTTILVNNTGAEEYTVDVQGVNAGRSLIVQPLSGQDNTVQVDVTGLVNAGTEPAWSYPYVVEHPSASGTYYQCIAPHTSEPANAPDQPGGVDFWTVLAGQPAWWDYQHGGSNDWVTAFNYSPWGRGFPRVGQFHGQRLILASIPDYGTTLWGSRIGNFTDFTGGPNDDDPFEFSLDSSDTPTIKWMRSQQNLLLGTSSGDWQLTAQVSLGPTDIQAVKQNNARSHNTLPAVIDNDIFYIEQGQSKLRASGYVRDNDSFSSTDISITAEHLFHEGIIRLVLIQAPEMMLFALRNDGQLLALAYEPNQGVGAWSEIQTTGAVIDIAGSYSVRELSAGQQDGIFPNEDGLYLVVLRSTGYSIEHMPYPSRVLPSADAQLTTQRMIWMDDWIAGEAMVETVVITGLDPLEGQTVGVLINDAWQVGEFVVTGGEINVEPFTGQWAVGLLYTATGETFEHAEGNPKGTGLGTKRRWNKLYIRTVDSALPIINGQLPPDRTPEQPMDVAEILRRGIRNNEVNNAGFGEGRITLIQDRPYPTQIVGLYGELQVHNA